MNNYESIEALNEAFLSGELTHEDKEFSVSGVAYQYRTSSKHEYISVLNKLAEGLLVYIVHPRDKESAIEAGVMDWIVLGYKERKPKRAFFTTKSRFGFQMKESVGDEKNVIGEYLEVRFVNLPSSNFLKGKVDTGADICSLHCDSSTVDESRNRITFTCSHLSQNEMTVPLAGFQAVKTADGVKNRPVIEMSVSINDTVYENVKFNLKDRSEMEYPVLVGQNLLDKGNFLIDPKQGGSNDVMEDELYVNWEGLFEAFNEELPPEEVPEIDDVDEIDEPETIEAGPSVDQLYQILRGSQITFSEFVEYANTYNADD